MEKREMICFAAFISIFYIAGFGVLGYSLWQLKRSTEAATWPTTTGEVVDCSIETDDDDEGTSHQVKVKYSYTVNEIDYIGDRLAFGYSGSSGLAAHEEILAKLETAEKVQVRYDPADPQNAVLSYGVHRSIRLTLAFAATWLAFVFGFSVLFWLSSQRDSVLLENLITL